MRNLGVRTQATRFLGALAEKHVYQTFASRPLGMVEVSNALPEIPLQISHGTVPCSTIILEAVVISTLSTSTCGALLGKIWAEKRIQNFSARINKCSIDGSRAWLEGDFATPSARFRDVAR